MVLEINKVGLDAVSFELFDVEGNPFWTTFCAAGGEFVRWDTPI